MRRPRTSSSKLTPSSHRPRRTVAEDGERWDVPIPFVSIPVVFLALVIWIEFIHNRTGRNGIDGDSKRPRALSLWEDVGHRIPCIIDKPPDDAPSSWTPLNEGDQRQSSKAGILFVKIDKAGSSTMAGVALRMAHALGRRRAQERGLDIPVEQQMCRARVSHAWSKQSDFSFGSRNRYKSFLFTMLRDPKTRAISEYNYQVGMAGLEPTEEYFLNHLKSIRNFQLGLMIHVDPSEKNQVEDVINNDKISEFVSLATEEFDFIGLLERLDESLVAMQFILGLETSDIIYSSTKQSGSHIFVKSRANNFKGECRRISKIPLSRRIEAYFEEDDWKRNNMGDYLLYEAANRDLDTIIVAIGRKRFEKALAQYRRAQSIADAKCKPTWPCTDEGRVRSSKEQVSECYLWDLGCNYRCLDKLVFEK